MCLLIWTVSQVGDVAHGPLVFLLQSLYTKQVCVGVCIHIYVIIEMFYDCDYKDEHGYIDIDGGGERICLSQFFF